MLGSSITDPSTSVPCSSESPASAVVDFDLASFDGARQNGDLLWERYQKAGATDPLALDGAIHATQIAVKLAPEPIDPQLSTDLGVRLLARLKAKFDIDELNNVVSVLQHAVDLTPDAHLDKRIRLRRLGTSLIERFHRTDVLDDLNSAITIFRCAVELPSHHGIDEAKDLSNYGSSLWERFVRLGSIEDLESALSIQSRAVELTPDSRSDKSAYNNNLGNMFSMRFEHSGKLEDLEKGIAAHRCASEHASDDDTNRPVYASNFANSLSVRFQQTGKLEDLEQAVSGHGRAVELTPDNHPNKPMWLNNLGSSLVVRYRRTGEFEYLDEGVASFRRAIELSPDGHPSKVGWLANLGNACLGRFERLGGMGDLEEAISCQRHAVELTPNGHAQKLLRLHNLGNSLSTRFECTGELADIHAAVSIYRVTVASLKDMQPQKPLWLSNLGSALLRRLGRTGEPQDLNEAVSALSHAIKLTPDGHPSTPLLLTQLGDAMLARFNRLGAMYDLDSSISLRRRAVELMPDDHPALPLRLHSFGTSVLARFVSTGELQFLEEAVSSYRRAISLTPDGHPEKLAMFGSLGKSLASRYRRTGELEDLERSIFFCRRATELTSDSHPLKPSRLSELGTVLSLRFDQTKNVADLEGAIEAQRKALELTPDGHPSKPTQMSSLCDVLRKRFEDRSNSDDIETAVSIGRLALDLIPDEYPEIHNTIAICYQRRFEYTGNIANLTSAISAIRKAIELTPDGHPYLSLWYGSLAGALRHLFTHSETQENYNSVIEAFMASIRQPFGDPSTRFISAQRCLVMISLYPSLTSVTSMMALFSSIIAIIPEIVWLGHSVHRRFDESAKLGELVNGIVAGAVAVGAYTQAVEWLEAGRSLIWSQVLTLRTPLGELQERQPRLAESLRSVQLQLQQSAVSSFVPDVVSISDAAGVIFNTSADHHRAVVAKYEALLKEIRACTSFERFLLPKRLKDVLPSPQLLDGPVVLINVHPLRCDAIIISPDGYNRLVPLTDLSSERAVKLRRLWVKTVLEGRARARGSVGSRSDLDGELKASKTYLAHMWNWIVRPILEVLDLTSLVRGDRLPHITWCPTGPLMQLPLHAAGLYNEPSGPRTYEFVVSSYTPSLSALLRGYSKIEGLHLNRDMLIVTQPSTPKHVPLPGTLHEGARLKNTLDESGIQSIWLNDNAATVQEVRLVMKRYPYVHLACHGSQNQHDATQSAFELFDGPLTLADLMGTAAENAELAFLSACQTAVGDEKTPEESAHLAAGMLAVGFRGVIATMWSIQDADAPIIVDAFYKELLAMQGEHVVGKWSTGAADALHEATRVLREKVGESSFLRWVPFVHFGV